MSEDLVTPLTKVLARSLRALGEAGRPSQASTLAATAWASLHRERPGDAERLNGLLHYLSRLPDHVVPPEDKENTMAEQDKQLDVRTEEPRRRHDLIFQAFVGLGPGEDFVLVNDHDPKPLYYQFAAEHAGAFSWEYLEQGPETWRVRIGRTPATV